MPSLVLVLLFIVAIFANADTGSLLSEKERNASLVFRGMKRDHMLFAHFLEDESTDRIIIEYLNFPVPTLRDPTFEGLIPGDIINARMTSNECFRTLDKHCASSEDVATILLAPTVDTICGNIRVRGQATLIIEDRRSIDAATNYASHCLSEANLKHRSLEQVSTGEDCLFFASYRGGGCVNPGDTCTVIKTRAKHIKEESCQTSSTGGSVCGTAGGGNPPGVCGEVKYQIATWKKSSNEKEENAFLGACTFVNNSWPAPNNCICKLSAATQTAMAAWINAPLPSPSCAGGSASCPVSKCPTVAPAKSPTPLPVSTAPAKTPTLSPASTGPTKTLTLLPLSTAPTKTPTSLPASTVPAMTQTSLPLSPALPAITSGRPS